MNEIRLCCTRPEKYRQELQDLTDDDLNSMIQDVAEETKMIFVKGLQVASLAA